MGLEPVGARMHYHCRIAPLTARILGGGHVPWPGFVPGLLPIDGFISQGFGGKPEGISLAAPGQYSLETLAENPLPLQHVGAGFGVDFARPDKPVRALRPVGQKVKRFQLRAGK